MEHLTYSNLKIIVYVLIMFLIIELIVIYRKNKKIQKLEDEHRTVLLSWESYCMQQDDKLAEQQTALSNLETRNQMLHNENRQYEKNNQELGMTLFSLNSRYNDLKSKYDDLKSELDLVSYSYNSEHEKNLALNQQNCSLQEQLNVIKTINSKDNSIEKDNIYLIAKELLKKDQRENVTKALKKLPSDDKDTKNRLILSKRSILSPNEARILYYLKKYVKKYDIPEQQKIHHVFPQVSMYSFIYGINEKILRELERSTNISSDDLKKQIKNLYLAKHIDFLVCVSEPTGKKYGYTTTYAYKPLFAIEIDGESHNVQVNGNSDQSRLDEEKNLIMKHLSDITFYRFTIENNKKLTNQTISILEAAVDDHIGNRS